MKNKLFYILALCFAFFIYFNYDIFIVVTYSNPVMDDVTNVIYDAENSIENSYILMLEIEKLGINITECLINLNAAGSLLDSAHNHYHIGNITGAFYYAELSIIKANSVNSDLKQLMASSAYKTNQSLTHTIILMIIYIITFLIISLFIWLMLKRHYLSNILKMKPKVLL